MTQMSLVIIIFSKRDQIQRIHMYDSMYIKFKNRQTGVSIQDNGCPWNGAQEYFHLWYYSSS